ncbi:LytR/AlgR family response regulator transcription factor [Flavobacterium solisilvae]|nr:response regulator transcription factor [Flavobacterium solisilvae]
MFSKIKFGKTLMKHKYIIVDDNHESILKTQANAMRFENLAFVGYANNYDDALNLILEQQPSLVFLEINPEKKESNLSLALINELYRYLNVVPKIIVTTSSQEMIFKAMEFGVADYLIKPLNINDFRKSILKFEKSIIAHNVVIPSQNVVSVGQNVMETVLANEPQVEIPSEDKPVEEIETTIEEEIAEHFVADDETIFEENLVIEEEEIQTETEETLEEITTDSTEEVLEENAEAIEIEENNQETETVEEVVTVEENKQDEEQQDEEVQILETKKIIVQQEQPLIICVKSYGDYRYIDSRDILYFEADNNSTDIHLKDGEMVTAFKTLKHFENVLPTNQFLRIHNSYIIGINHVARIHTGNAVCFIKNSTIKLPFSKSYRDNVELIIHRIASGNYLEI